MEVRGETPGQSEPSSNFTPVSDRAPKKSDNPNVIGLNETLEPEHPDIADVGFLDLYRYATPVDFLILAISTFASVAGGAVIPWMTVSLFIFLISLLISKRHLDYL
jgi:hypothetical protein